MPDTFAAHFDRVGMMIKPCGDSCIGACAYCYYHDPSKGRYTQELLDPAVLETLIRQFMELGCPQPLMSWQGGEPALAGLAYFQQAAAWQKQYASASQRVQNAFQTCGLLLDEEWCAFLAKENWLVGLSIDGPADLHDSVRLDREGCATHARVLRAYEMLKSAGAEVNILSVISRASVGRAGEIYQHIRELGSDFLQFIPCGPGREGRGHSKLMLRDEEYGQFMLDLMEAWIAEDNPAVYLRTNDNMLHLWFGLPAEFCQYRRGCLSMITVEADGAVYPCDFFVEPMYQLGTIQEKPLRELAFNDVHRQFYHDTGRLHRQCRDCTYCRFCHGGCLRQRNNRDPRGRNMLCASMKLLFRESFQRFDDLLSGTRTDAPRITAFLRDLVGRYGWPRESKLKRPAHIPLVAGGPALHEARTGGKGNKRKR